MTKSTSIRLAPLAAVLALFTAGCARPPFPQQTMDQVDRTISFSELSRDPAGFKGKWVMLGGVFVRSNTEKDGSTYLEIVQKPSDKEGRPLHTDRTGGRFIAVSKEFLDPVLFQHNREVTIVGEVKGEITRPLDEMPYRYPLLEIKGLHIWEPYSGPRFGVGVGIGVFHRY